MAHQMDIEAQQSAVGPATRAAVVARLTADEPRRPKAETDRMAGP